jgi:hypothetical protein
MHLLRHEFIEVASRPLLWLGTLTFGIFMIYSVGHLGIEQDKVRVAIYQTQADTIRAVSTFAQAQRLLEEMANVEVRAPDRVITDIATEMLKDDVDIALTRTSGGWRFTLKSRSNVEHARLVRVAQVLGATIALEKPWALTAYDQLRRPSSPQSDGWPGNVQISGITADPGKHARVFIPKTIALLAYFTAFAFACRSMIRDISNNTLPAILVASGNQWLWVVVAKLLVSVMMGVIVLWTLFLFATWAQDFQSKDGLYLAMTVQLMSLLASGLLGITFSLLARTESRIYLIASAYLILLVLLSGLIARVEPNELILSGISSVFPLGYAMDLLSDWMFFGFVPVFGDNPTQTIAAVLMLTAVATYGSVLYFKRTL